MNNKAIKLSVFIFLWIGLAVAISTVPYLFPPQQLVGSYSYDVGFNNKIALLLTVLGCLLFIALGLVNKNNKVSSKPIISVIATNQNLISIKTFWRLSGVCAFIYAIIGLLCGKYSYLGTEMQYFIPHVYDVMAGRTPYVSFEYFYGPAFVYVPAFFATVFPFIGVTGGYTITAIIFQVIGIYFLMDIVNALSLEKKEKNYIFIGYTIYTFPLHMGLNGNMLRITIGIWILMKTLNYCQSNTNSLKKIIVIVLSGIIPFFIAVEQAIFTNIVLWILVLLNIIYQKSWNYLGASLGLFVVYTAIISFFPDYILIIKDFSTGCNNLPVNFGVPLLMLLLCVFMLSYSIGGKLRDINSNKNELLLLLMFFAGLPAMLANHLTTVSFLAILGYVVLRDYSIWIKRFLYVTFLYFVTMSVFGHLTSRIYRNAWYVNAECMIYKYNLCKSDWFKSFLSKVGVNSEELEVKCRNAYISNNIFPFKVEPSYKIAMPFVRNNTYYIYLNQKKQYASQYVPKLLWSPSENSISRTIADLSSSRAEYVLMPQNWQALSNSHHRPISPFASYILKDRIVLRNGNKVYQPLIDYINDNYRQVDNQNFTILLKHK